MERFWDGPHSVICADYKVALTLVAVFVTDGYKVAAGR
jgi:hypothetical protein